MRRIIDGKAYDTERAKAIYTVDEEQRLDEIKRDTGISSQEADQVETLYLTRGGAFFLHRIYNIGLEQPDDIEPTTSDEARRWLEEHANHLVEEVFGPVAEAGLGLGSLSLRMPKTLKARVERAAIKRGQSTNGFIVRLLEQFLDGKLQPARKTTTRE